MTEPTTAAGRRLMKRSLGGLTDAQFARAILAIETEARTTHSHPPMETCDECQSALAALPPSAPPALDEDVLHRAGIGCDSDCFDGGDGRHSAKPGPIHARHLARLEEQGA